MKDHNKGKPPRLQGHYNRWVIASTGVKETTCAMPDYARGSMGEVARHMLHSGVIVELDTGQILTTSSAGQSWVFLVLDGVLELILSRGNGDELSLAQRYNGDLVGELGMLSLGTGNIQVCAQTKVRCVRVSRGDFRELLSSNTASMRMLYVHLARSLHDITQKMESMVFDNVQQRVHRQLHSLCASPMSERHRDGLLVTASRTQLARAIGCTREAVGRALGLLQHEGHIVVRGSKILMRGEVVPAMYKPDETDQ